MNANTSYLILCLIFFIVGCNRITPEIDIDINHEDCDQAIVETKASSERIVYYSGERYSIGREPNRLDDAKRAFRKDDLAPTHKAVRITPRSMAQLECLEKDTSLVLFYHPFGYTLLPSINSGVSSIITANPGGLEPCLGDDDIEEDNDTRTILPIYAFWPFDLDIPSDIDYDYCYDAFLPLVQDRDDVLLPTPILIHGQIRAYDNRLNQYIPLQDIELEYTSQYLQFHPTQRVSTDSTGSFSIRVSVLDGTLNLNLCSTSFIIRDGETSNLKSIALGSFSDHVDSTYYAQIDFSANFALDIFKSAQYYFYDSNDLLNLVDRYDISNNTISIQAINHEDYVNHYAGCFYRLPSNPYISIWNYYSSYYSGVASFLFGTVLHELGHATNYVTTGYETMTNTDRIIRESFAELFAWYNVSQFYSSLVTSDNSVNYICGDGRQSWTQASSSINYTPFFVDLWDNYNQHMYDNDYNDDPIFRVPLSILVNLSLGPTSFSSVLSSLASYIGSYFSYSDYQTFIAPYSIF